MKHEEIELTPEEEAALDSVLDRERRENAWPESTDEEIEAMRARLEAFERRLIKRDPERWKRLLQRT